MYCVHLPVMYTDAIMLCEDINLNSSKPIGFSKILIICRKQNAIRKYQKITIRKSFYDNDQNYVGKISYRNLKL